MCGYVCVNCGRCRGEKKTMDSWSCIFCGTAHAAGTKVCSFCGKAIMPPPGTTVPTAETAQAN